jgi:hypothetical protein
MPSDLWLVVATPLLRFLEHGAGLMENDASRVASHCLGSSWAMRQRSIASRLKRQSEPTLKAGSVRCRSSG